MVGTVVVYRSGSVAALGRDGAARDTGARPGRCTRPASPSTPPSGVVPAAAALARSGRKGGRRAWTVRVARGGADRTPAGRARGAAGGPVLAGSRHVDEPARRTGRAGAGEPLRRGPGAGPRPPEQPPPDGDAPVAPPGRLGVGGGRGREPGAAARRAVRHARPHLRPGRRRGSAAARRLPRVPRRLADDLAGARLRVPRAVARAVRHPGPSLGRLRHRVVPVRHVPGLRAVPVARPGPGRGVRRQPRPGHRGGHRRLVVRAARRRAGRLRDDALPAGPRRPPAGGAGRGVRVATAA
jgi:hypothetical protein